MEITNVHKTFGILFFESSDFCTGIIHHEVRRIPRWVPSLDYGKCFTYRGLIFGLAHEFSHNLISHVGVYINEKSGIAYLVVLYVASIRASSLPYLSNIRCLRKVSSAVPGLGSSFSLMTASLVR